MKSSSGFWSGLHTLFVLQLNPARSPVMAQGLSDGGGSVNTVDSAPCSVAVERTRARAPRAQRAQKRILGTAKGGA